MTFDEIIKKRGRRIKKHVYYVKNGTTTNINDNNIDSIKFTLQSSIIGTSIKGCELILKEKIEGDIYVQVVAKYKLSTQTKTYGPYYLKEEPAYQAEKKNYIHKTYDNMLKSMVDYQLVNINYPCTVLAFFQAVVAAVGYTNNILSLPNGAQQIPNDIFQDIGYTYRDVLDDVAVANGVLFYVDGNEIKIATRGGDDITIDDDILKNKNISFGEHYGPINTIVLSRSGESDNIYYPTVLPENPVEFKIKDNQLMNENNRSDYLPALYTQLNGLEYDIYDTELTGLGDVRPLQTVNFETGDNEYSSYIFNNEITLTDGYKQAIYNEMPEQTETDYKAASTEDKAINSAYIIVRKNEAEIESLANKIVELSDTKSGVGSITLENAYEGQLYQLSIKGQISLLFPQSEEGLYGYPLVPSDELVPSDNLTPSSPVPYQNQILYPSDELFTKSSNLIVDNTKYKLDLDFLNYINNDICDEFVYDNGTCYIIRRVGIDENGDKYALENEVIEPRRGVVINVEKNSTISLESFNNAILKATYLLENEYTDNFATQVEVQSEIKQTADSITSTVSANYVTKGELATTKSEIKQTTDSISLEVSEKVGDDEIISKINQSAESVSINANKINLNGVVTANDNFKILTDGSMEAKNGTFKGVINTNQDCVIGNNLYVGQNQSSTSNLTKYIKLSDDTYIKRMYGNYEGLNLNTTYNMSFSVNDNNDNETNIFVADYYDIILQNINQYIWLHNGYISSSSDIISDSDKRLKQNIKDIDVSWIDDLKVKEFEYKKNPNIKHIGLIAQDYLDKEYSKNFVIKKEDGYYGIAYQSISNALIQYCQELKQEIENLKKEMEELKNGFSRISK